MKKLMIFVLSFMMGGLFLIPVNAEDIEKNTNISVQKDETNDNQLLTLDFGNFSFTTNDILEKVGIARGTLYYHFKSKEDIMDALIDRYNTHILDAARQIAEDKSMPIYERIMRAVMALNIRPAN